jgi:probable addiction module antidote protein
MARSRPYVTSLLQALKDPDEAAAYLDAALEDGDTEAFLLALRRVAEARLGGMSQLADASTLNRESLYRMLSAQGNPSLVNLEKVLHALGLRLSVATEPEGARVTDEA